jgi:uncharacterized protein YndB with AHSA1/START domain
MTDTPMTAGYEMELERTFDAPRELVFDCFTKAEHMQAWWGPREFTNPVCEIDARMGGKILIHMQGPEPFGVNPMEGEFIEVTRPSKLIFTSRAMQGPDGEWGIDNLNTLTFVEKDGKTVMTLRTQVRKVSEAVRPALAGMREGWSQSLDKLAELMTRLQA